MSSTSQSARTARHFNFSSYTAAPSAPEWLIFSVYLVVTVLHGTSGPKMVIWSALTSYNLWPAALVVSSRPTVTTLQWRHQNFFGGVSRGQNTILRGQKSKNLPKMAYFGPFYWGASGGRASDWGEMPPCPLDASTATLSPLLTNSSATIRSFM